MLKLYIEEKDYARIIACLNAISDIAEEATQKVFTIDKARKGNANDIMAYEMFASMGEEAVKAWSTLQMAYRHSKSKIVVEV